MEDSVTLKKLLLYFILFIPSLIFGFLEYNVAMGTWAGIGIGILLIININKLESFKGLGVEAKMRDLSNLITEGNELVEKLKDVAIGISEPILNQLAYEGLTIIQKPNLSHVALQFERIVDLLSKLDIEKSKIDLASDLFIQVFKTKFLNIIKWKINENKELYDNQLLKELNAIDLGIEDESSKLEFVKQLNKFQNLNAEIKNLLIEYNSFSISGKFNDRGLLD